MTVFALAVRLVFLAMISAASPVFAAQPGSDYPVRAIRFVVPQPPGGGTDTVARMLAPRLSESLRQPVIIDNRSGAGGIVGTETVAKAQPDGYTILLGYTGALTINPSLHKDLSYRPVEDFDPISLAVASPFILFVNPSVRATSVQELIALAKSQPGRLNFGSPGNGSLHHLSMEWFKSSTGTQMVHIPFKGGQSLNALLAGDIQLTLGSAVAWMGHIKTGRLRAIAVTSKVRSRVLPELPTIAESGIPGFESKNWFGVLAPRGTPAPIVTRLSTLIAGYVNSPELRERVLADGADPVGSTPAQFAALIKDEIKRWREVVRISGAKLD
jgi:tripartite-type tricarboxylate transporter receptor subunit TctC